MALIANPWLSLTSLSNVRTMCRRLNAKRTPFVWLRHNRHPVRQFQTCGQLHGGSEGTEDHTVPVCPPDMTIEQLGQDMRPPTNCCMSGCVNCVWIEYAEKMAKYYVDGGERIRDEIKKIPDPNLQAFLEIELKTRKT